MLDNKIRDVFASGNNIYAAIEGGLSISINGGTSWTAYTTADGLGANFLQKMSISDNTRYVATSNSGLSVAALSADPNPVPAQLPVLGSTVALGFCRRLRSQSQRLRHAAGRRLG